ncbi:cache domain-containing protein [Tengunoibacter tsumagoiensis]|uniref:Cache domain-containing protein n=1 Tax=Tengunoibacter tsumagoiensis TaxID=2014871 RepID=A0A401ZZQ0_9CHLR|nr:cache domain-containing protein [Tengunoibacter tsumagoiensis]GCE12345.1 hypothetical protein KTT_22040 [Tengunoibacter tsumagoiensis]
MANLSSGKQFRIYRRWFTLPARIAIGLVLAAIVPLLALLIYMNFTTRPALIDQANKAMASDAQTRVQLIDTYFNERVLDTQTLTQIPTVQAFLLTQNPVGSQAYNDDRTHALYSLQAGIYRNASYINWSLFTDQGKLLLAYPENPTPHGSSLVPLEELRIVDFGIPHISPVYYNAKNQQATIDIYAPINGPQGTPSQDKVIGFLRATLNLNYIWQNIVQNDTENNGAGSGAFILDDNGVYIADSNPVRRFHSAGTVSDLQQQHISQELRYGTDKPVVSLANAALVDANAQKTGSTTFQAQLSDDQGNYQIARRATDQKLVPWNYYVFSPESSETAVANAQQESIILLAVIASLLVAIAGFFAGQGLAQPIIRSAVALQENSLALSTLASNQQDAAAEQMWVVDSSQVGLQSVQYYTEAAKTVSRQLREAATELAQRGQFSDSPQMRHILGRIMEAAKYIEEASNYQSTSSQKLSTALKVATQVTEQLHGGATSANEAAKQLQLIVQELRAIIGR